MADEMTPDMRCKIIEFHGLLDIDKLLPAISFLLDNPGLGDFVREQGQYIFEIWDEVFDFPLEGK